MLGTCVPIVDLRGKRGLVVGIANEHSIAAGCADAFTHAGNTLAATYLSAKAEGYLPLEPAPGRYVHE